jgi:23S rRNA (uridine2552-2'-O)-methyltransferase
VPKAWIEKRKRDYYYRKAKVEKYRSRASYKLLQVIEKYHFIKEGDVVVDLGAAPGGWLQVSSNVVGDSGYVLGIDIKPIEPLPIENIQTMIDDITEPYIVEKIKGFLPRKADVVISDVSPNISGVWEIDHAKQIDLAFHSLNIATKILKPKGSFFVKIFQGDLMQDFIKEMKKNFEKVKIIKPKASKAESSEIYILGQTLKI